jgi:hypothetical protein
LTLAWRYLKQALTCSDPDFFLSILATPEHYSDVLLIFIYLYKGFQNPEQGPARFLSLMQLNSGFSVD